MGYTYRPILFKLFLLVLPLSSFGQWNKDDTVYAMNYWIDIPVTIAGHAFNLWGQEVLRNYPTLTEEDYGHLTPEDVNPFDRVAARQDPDYAETAHNLSDIGMNVSVVLPLFAVLDRKIRPNFLNYTLLYLETHAINATLYLAATLPIRRYRPYVYNPDEYVERKEGPKSTDSFFSGHVSVATASTFFLAKVLTDYHPGLKRKQFLIYGLATIPAFYTAYYRLKAGKHFPTDLMVGYAIGASVGILVPELHKAKWWKRLAINGLYQDGARGLRFAYQF